MATEPLPPDDITAEARKRLDDCKRHKARHDWDIREAYFFTDPPRSLMLTSDVAPQKWEPDVKGTLQISIGMECAENFATSLTSSFMPFGMEWVKLEASSTVPEDYKQEVEEKVSGHVTTTFGLINQSNFYPELAKAVKPDAAIGTFAVWVKQGRRLIDEPMCSAVELRELEIDIGPDGQVDTRFVVRHTRNRFVRSLIGSRPKIDDKMTKEMKDNPNAETVIRWGFWRKWDEQDVVWQHVIMLKNTVIFQETLRGEGSCPLIVCRFNPSAASPFGNGPAIRALPELRHLDDMAAGETEAIDVTLRPPMAYPDDSFTAIEDGVEPGGWYPIRPGSEGAVKPMFPPPKLDAALFDQQARERRVKRMFYDDFPEQRGDTPPTATQWVDEMAMAQRKLGTPGMSFWREGPREFFMRFYWLAKKRGLIEPVTMPGGRSAVSLAPYNPTQRAQDSQKVATAVRAGQIAAALFPEEFKIRFDGANTMDNIFRLMDVQDVFAKRSQQDIQNAVSQLSQVGAAQGGAPPAMGSAPMGGQ